MCSAGAAKASCAGIAFDINLPMGNSSCVSCGECMVSCPTGALTNKSVVKTVLPGEPVDVDELQQLAYFQKVSGTFLELNKNAVVRRHFKKGEIVCREGEYGSTAFYILEGQAEVFLVDAHGAREDQGGASGFFSRLTSRCLDAARSAAKKKERAPAFPSTPRSICRTTIPSPTLGPGDLFGEMTCMNLYPRSATVRAATDCVMFEMLRNVLDIIQRNKTLQGAARSQLPQTRARRSSAQRAAVRVAHARILSTCCATMSSWCAIPRAT